MGLGRLGGYDGSGRTILTAGMLVARDTVIEGLEGQRV
jgi:hypothetical protein